MMTATKKEAQCGTKAHAMETKPGMIDGKSFLEKQYLT